MIVFHRKQLLWFSFVWTHMQTFMRLRFECTYKRFVRDQSSLRRNACIPTWQWSWNGLWKQWPSTLRRCASVTCPWIGKCEVRNTDPPLSAPNIVLRPIVLVDHMDIRLDLCAAVSKAAKTKTDVKTTGTTFYVPMRWSRVLFQTKIRSTTNRICDNVVTRR